MIGGGDHGAAQWTYDPRIAFVRPEPPQAVGSGPRTASFSPPSRGRRSRSGAKTAPRSNGTGRSQPPSDPSSRERRRSELARMLGSVRTVSVTPWELHAVSAPVADQPRPRASLVWVLLPVEVSPEDLPLPAADCSLLPVCSGESQAEPEIWNVPLVDLPEDNPPGSAVAYPGPPGEATDGLPRARRLHTYGPTPLTPPSSEFATALRVRFQAQAALRHVSSAKPTLLAISPQARSSSRSRTISPSRSSVS